MLLNTFLYGVVTGHGQKDMCTVCTYSRNIAKAAFAASFLVVLFIPDFKVHIAAW